MNASTALLREIAQDLTALHDPSLILTGVVRRVRATLGSDLAYISLNDAVTRETRITFADGVNTPEYAAIRMPIGTGVLGLAAAGVTAESPDYLPDVARLHVEDVDAAVGAEGVRAILGTPLRAAGEVVGTLTIANRVPGRFSADQRSALEDAALVASSAVEVYRLRRDLDEQALAHREEVARLREESSASIAQLSLSRELSTALARGLNSGQLVEIAATTLGGTVVISPTVDGENTSDTYPMEVGGGIEIRDSDPDIAAMLAPTVASFLSIALLYEHAIEDARHFREAELVERLVDPSAGPSSPPPRTGLPGTGDLDVLVVDMEDAQNVRPALARIRHLLGPRAIAATRRGSIIVIIRSDESAHGTLRAALDPFHHYAGIATTSDETALPVAHGAAALLARAAARLTRADRFTSWTDLGVVAFAMEGRPSDAHAFVSARLAPIASDSERDAALRATALHYLDTQGSVAEVARRLTVHENTVRQRVGRLDALIPGWRGEQSLDVHVALRALLLLEA